MTRSQCVSKIATLKEKIADMQRQVKQCEDEIKRIDTAKCTRLLEQHNVDPEELEDILRMYSAGRRGGKAVVSAKRQVKAAGDGTDGSENMSSEMSLAEPEEMQEDIVFPQELLSDEGGSEG